MGRINGVVTADIVEVRFAFAGRLANLAKHPGDIVKVGELLASLDRKELQTVLDKELADYEKIRAEFEIFVLDHANPADDRTKYEKVQAQSLLNTSVKAVELAKINLDAVDLISPVNGIVVENGNMRRGMYITPGSYTFRILDTDSLIVSARVEKEITRLLPSGTSVKIRAGDEEIPGTVLPYIPSPKGNSLLRIRPEKSDSLQIGDTVSLEL